METAVADPENPLGEGKRKKDKRKKDKRKKERKRIVCYIVPRSLFCETSVIFNDKCNNTYL